MIEKMQKLFLYGLSEDASPLLRDVMRCGCLQVSDPRQLEPCDELPSVVEKHSSELYDWEQKLSRLSAALTALLPYLPGKGLFAQKPSVTYQQLEDITVMENAFTVCEQVEAAQRQLTEQKAALGRQSFTRDSLLPWNDYYLPLGQQGTRTCKVQLLTLPAAVELTAVEQSLSQSELAATISQIGSDKDQYYLGLIAHNDSFAQAEELLRQAGASRVSFGELSGTPSEELARCQGEIQALEQQIAQTEATFAMLAQQGDLLKQVFDGVQTRIHCLRAEQKLLHTEKTCLLAGWIPVRSKPQLEKLLAGYTCYYQFVEPQKDEETPVLLKNNKLVEPFECVTEMYSLPSSNGIDPDPFMAPFFFLFFGMMLSDAGYGLLLLVGGLIGAKLMGGNKLMKMLGYCGISTIVWGLIYGSFFGDMLTQVARVFFHVEFALPALIDPLKDPITILVLSFAFGALHLFVGMGLKAYLMVRRGHAWAALFDVGSWYFVLIGLVMLLAGGIFGKIGMYMAIGGAVMLILTQGRDKKNIFMKAASGVLSLYDITGYFSDILSYSRIMALGLATGVIGSVVNTMGTMPGGSFFGFLVYLAVFLFGHTLNFAINALGSYVHTSRLQYVEFFGKFYEGGGAGFAPLTANTKYVNIKIQEEK